MPLISLPHAIVYLIAMAMIFIQFFISIALAGPFECKSIWPPKVQFASEQDALQIFEISKQTFDSEGLRGTDFSDIQLAIERGNVFVVKYEGAVLGYTLFEIPEPGSGMHEEMVREVYYSQRPELESSLLEALRQNNSNSSITYYQNNFTTGIWTLPLSNFIYISETAVRPNYRRQGIGKALKLKELDYARTEGLTGIYLHVRADYPIETLNKKLGFVELIKRKPMWENGDGALSMFRKP